MEFKSQFRNSIISEWKPQSSHKQKKLSEIAHLIENKKSTIPPRQSRQEPEKKKIHEN